MVVNKIYKETNIVEAGNTNALQKNEEQVEFSRCQYIANNRSITVLVHQLFRIWFILQDNVKLTPKRKYNPQIRGNTASARVFSAFSRACRIVQAMVFPSPPLFSLQPLVPSALLFLLRRQPWTSHLASFFYQQQEMKGRNLLQISWDSKNLKLLADVLLHFEVY